MTNEQWAMMRALLTGAYVGFAIAASGCGEAEPQELERAQQPLFNAHSGSSSRTIGFTEQNTSPWNGSCSGPDVGGYTCWLPFPSWWAWELSQGGDGASGWNYWKYFDPEDFNAIAQSFNSWLGFAAGTNGLADAWAQAQANVGDFVMSYENDTSDDQFIVHAIINDSLSGVAPTNQTLLIHQSLRLRVFEDGGTLTESPGHPATFRYARSMQWEVDVGTLGAWIGANCTTTACKRKSVHKIFGIVLMQAMGAPLNGTIAPSDFLAPYIFVGGPPAGAYTVSNGVACLFDRFSYGTNLSLMQHGDICPWP